MSDAFVTQLRKVGRTTVGRPAIVTGVSPLTVEGGLQPFADPSLQLQVGDSVLLSIDGSSARVLRSLTARPTQGTVSAVGATTATVSTSAGSLVLEWIGSAPSVSDRVGIVWGPDGSYISGTLSAASATTPTATASATPAAESAAPSRSTVHRIVAVPAVVCTSDGGAWTNWGSRGVNAVQGRWTGSPTYKTGWAFYGNQFAGDSGRVATEAFITLKRGPFGVGSSTAATAHLRLHASRTKGSTPPALMADSYDIPGFKFGGTIRKAIPLVLAQKFLDGTAAGVALAWTSSGDYAEFLGITNFSAAFVVEIVYTEGA